VLPAAHGVDDTAAIHACLCRFRADSRAPPPQAAGGSAA